jgi:hypothetical protein
MGVNRRAPCKLVCLPVPSVTYAQTVTGKGYAMKCCWLLVLASLTLVGCSAGNQSGSSAATADKGQWVLESYDATKGYTFHKDGVEYQGHCQVVRHDGKSNRATWEEACIDVLPYLHKTVPVTLSGAQLTFKNPNSGGDDELVFLITAAK